MHRLPLFAALLIMPAPLLADPAAPAIAGTRLDVSATGEVSRKPDLATIGAGVVTQAPTAAQAIADNAARMAATIAALRKAGVADRDIQTASLRLSPQYRYADNQPPALTGYQVSNSVSVRLRDLARAGGIVDALVAAGANQIDGPSLSVEKPDVALDEARTLAVAAARSRANLYARAAGLHVARIVSIAETGSDMPGPIRPMMLMASARKLDTPIEPGEAPIRATLQVTFELN